MLFEQLCFCNKMEVITVSQVLTFPWKDGRSMWPDVPAMSRQLQGTHRHAPSLQLLNMLKCQLSPGPEILNGLTLHYEKTSKTMCRPLMDFFPRRLLISLGAQWTKVWPPKISFIF